jgi:hypothetical protein
MAIKSEKIEGSKIITLVESSNFKSLEYDTLTESLVIEFNNGSKYEYEKVPHRTFTQMRLAESQGKFFKTNIEKTFKFKKL